MSTSESTRVFHLPFSFMLPQKIAAERGYFTEEGLEVDLVERDRRSVDWKYVPSEETLTHDQDVDIYPACKWESIRRTHEFGDGTVVAQASFSNEPYSVFTRPETDVETPADLADVSVGVNRRTGQEYTAIKALENHVDEDDVSLAHLGMPTNRIQGLRNGAVDAVTLLEPHSTLARHLGLEEILSFDNHIGIVASDRIDDDTLDAFMAAYRRAAAAINEDPDAHSARYVEMLEADAEVAPDLFDDVDLDAVRETVTVPTYEVPDAADRADLERELDWMKRHGMVDSETNMDAVVESE